MNRSRRWMPMAGVLVLVGLVVLAGPTTVRQIAYAVQEARDDAARRHVAELGEHDQLSALFREVSSLASPAVVTVRTMQKVRVPDFNPFEWFFDEGAPFRFHFDNEDSPFEFRFGVPRRRREGDRRRMPRYEMRQGVGSGVIIDAKNGYVLTNYHVVADADEVEVTLSDDRKLEAEWVRRDPRSDLAVIKISPDRLSDIPLGDSDEAQVGDWVLAIGAPRGLAQTVTAGIISAKGRQEDALNPFHRFLQTDAAINKGNSGGPLVNMKGQVIGINTAIRSYSGGNEGIGFAIPSNVAREVMQELIDGKRVVGGFLERGFLGVQPQDVDEKMAKSLRLPDTRGAMVVAVVPSSAAEKAGLKVGDFIVSVDGKPIADEFELRRAIGALKPGTEIRVGFYRDGRRQEVDVTVGQTQTSAVEKRGDEESEAEAAEKFGLAVETLSAEQAKAMRLGQDTKGVQIVEVDPDSDAFAEGLRPGMVITHVGADAVSTTDEFDRALTAGQKAGGVALRVASGAGAFRYVFIMPSKE